MIHLDIPVSECTTFATVGTIDKLIDVESVDDLIDALQQYPAARILGGGSNILCVNDRIDAVIRIAIRGKEVIEETSSTVTIRAGAGENWHQLVQWTVDKGWGGIENLALIPGTVGAAPLQNIGAYGVEQRSTFRSCRIVNTQTFEKSVLSNAECQFGYRDSIFKRELRGKAIVTHVEYMLYKNPVVNTSYSDVYRELAEVGIVSPTSRDIFDAIVRIRTRKLPDPAIIGNAGSFFKNPVVSAAMYQDLHIRFNDIPGYEQPDGTVKLAAAWLIDKSGWKGYRDGNVGVHTQQALVLVNHGGASGKEILDLSERIQASVQQKFGVQLEREVNVW